MKYVKTLEEFTTEKELQEKLSEGWVDAQLIDDAAGLDAGAAIMVNKEDFLSAAPDQDIEICSADNRKCNDVIKGNIELKESAVNEKRIGPPNGGFDRKSLEDVLKKRKDIEIWARNNQFYIPPFLHDKGKLEDATDKIFYALDRDGGEVEFTYDEIEFIEG